MKHQSANPFKIDTHATLLYKNDKKMINMYTGEHVTNH